MADGQDSLGMSGVRSTFSDRSSDQVQVMLHRNNRLHGQLLPGAQRAAAELGADDTKPDMPDVQMTGSFSPHNTSSSCCIIGARRQRPPGGQACSSARPRFETRYSQCDLGRDHLQVTGRTDLSGRSLRRPQMGPPGI